MESIIARELLNYHDWEIDINLSFLSLPLAGDSQKALASRVGMRILGITGVFQGILLSGMYQ